MHGTMTTEAQRIKRPRFNVIEISLALVLLFFIFRCQPALRGCSQQVHGPNACGKNRKGALHEPERRASARLVGRECLATGRADARRSNGLVQGPNAAPLLEEGAFHEPERRSPTRPVGKYSPASSRVGDRKSVV